MPVIFLLTGDVQIGKSRWLESLVHDLKGHGVTSHGLISAGIWVDASEDAASDVAYATLSEGDAHHAFEKIGIETILLPSEERFEFAKREDLAKEDGSYEQNNSADKAKLHWNIREDALHRANEHLSTIEASARESEAKSILIIDELGRLELCKNEGLTEALRILFDLKDSVFDAVIVVVRSGLVELAERRFREAGLSTERIAPDEISRARVLIALS